MIIQREQKANMSNTITLYIASPLFPKYRYSLLSPWAYYNYIGPEEPIKYPK